ncbi:MAG: Penicillin-binding protein 2, partial [Microgenomates group bacterium GW2011_GWF2_47_9]
GLGEIRQGVGAADHVDGVHRPRLRDPGAGVLVPGDRRQGDLLATPLQIARMTAGAVSGRLCKVSILKDSQVVCEDLGLKTENIEIVTSGMKQVCQVGGTAFPFFDFVPPVMCKTGTAQHGGQKSESDLPHAWIVVVYPAENPEMVLTVMLDSAGEGSYEAGPVAREILERWLSAKR